MNLVAAAHPRMTPKATVNAKRAWRDAAVLLLNRRNERNHRQYPERRQDPVVRRIVTVGKKVRLENPATGRERRCPFAPFYRQEREDRAGCQAKQQDRPQARMRQLVPRRRQKIAGQPNQGIKRRMAMRLFSRERPEPSENVAIEQELLARIELIWAGR